MKVNYGIILIYTGSDHMRWMIAILLFLAIDIAIFACVHEVLDARLKSSVDTVLDNTNLLGDLQESLFRR